MASICNLYDGALRHNSKGIDYVENSYFTPRFEAIKETVRKLSRDFIFKIDLNDYLSNQYFILEFKDLIPIQYFDTNIRNDKKENAIFGLGTLFK